MTFIFLWLALCSNQLLAQEVRKHPGATFLESACAKDDLPSCQGSMTYYEEGGVGESYLAVSLKACQLGDKKGCSGYLLNTEVRSMAFWTNHPHQQIGLAPPELVEFLRIDNFAQVYAENPISAPLDPSLVSMTDNIMRELPDAVARLFKRKLLGIYFVENLGTSAYGLNIFGNSGNTAFNPDPAIQLEVTIESGRENTVKNGFQFILLHELGHLLARTRNLTPDGYPRENAEF